MIFSGTPIAGSAQNPASSRGDQYAQAFRNLEAGICDCVKMSHIAAQLLMNDGKAAPFAVAHLDEMLRRLKHEYYAAYHGSVGTRSLVTNEARRQSAGSATGSGSRRTRGG
jgi:hypothetical protein